MDPVVEATKQILQQWGALGGLVVVLAFALWRINDRVFLVQSDRLTDHKQIILANTESSLKQAEATNRQTEAIDRLTEMLKENVRATGRREA